MPTPRVEAINRLLVDVDAYEINLNHYYDELDLQRVYDNTLSGKLDTLSCYCKALGWSELAGVLNETLPLEGNAVEALERAKGFVLPEIRRLLEHGDIESEPTPTDWFWELIHPRICALAKPRYDAGFFGDAVETSFKEVNDSVKRIHLDQTGKEADGSGLMTSAFSPANPSIRLNEQKTESERNIQQGYMQIFAGSIVGIRNPKAHANLNPDPRKTLHLINLASLLMYKVDERI